MPESFAFRYIPAGTKHIGAYVDVNGMGANAYFEVPLAESFGARAFPISLIIPRSTPLSQINLYCNPSFCPLLQPSGSYELLVRAASPQCFFPIPPSGASMVFCQQTGEALESTGSEYLLHARDGLVYAFPGLYGCYPTRVELPDGMHAKVEVGSGGVVLSMGGWGARRYQASFAYSNGLMASGSLALYGATPSDLLQTLCSFYITQTSTGYRIVVYRNADGLSSVTDTYDVRASASGSDYVVSQILYSSTDFASESLSVSRTSAQVDVSAQCSGESQARVRQLSRPWGSMAEWRAEDGETALFCLAPAPAPSLFPRAVASLSRLGAGSCATYDQQGRPSSLASPCRFCADAASRHSLLADPSFGASPSPWLLFGGAQFSSGACPLLPSALYGATYASLPAGGSVGQSQALSLLPGESLRFAALLSNPSSSPASAEISVRLHYRSGGHRDLSFALPAADFPGKSVRPFVAQVCADRAVEAVDVELSCASGSFDAKCVQALRGAGRAAVGYEGCDPSSSSDGRLFAGAKYGPGERHPRYLYGSARSPMVRYAAGSGLPSLATDDLGGSEELSYSNAWFVSQSGGERNYRPAQRTRTAPGGSPKAREEASHDDRWRPLSDTREGVPTQTEYDASGRAASLEAGTDPKRVLTLDSRGRPTEWRLYGQSPSAYLQYAEAGLCVASGSALAHEIGYYAATGYRSTWHYGGFKLSHLSRVADFSGRATCDWRSGDEMYDYSYADPSRALDHLDAEESGSTALQWDAATLADGEATGVSYSGALGSSSASYGQDGRSATVQETIGPLSFQSVLCGGSAERSGPALPSARHAATLTQRTPLYAGDRKTWSHAMAAEGFLCDWAFEDGDAFALSDGGIGAPIQFSPQLSASRDGLRVLSAAPGSARASFGQGDASWQLCVLVAFSPSSSAGEVLRLHEGQSSSAAVSVSISADSSVSVSISGSPAASMQLGRAEAGWNCLALALSPGAAAALLNGAPSSCAHSLPLGGVSDLSFGPSCARASRLAVRRGADPLGDAVLRSAALLTMADANPAAGAGQERSYSALRLRSADPACPGLRALPLESALCFDDGLFPLDADSFAAVGKPGLPSGAEADGVAFPPAFLPVPSEGRSFLLSMGNRLLYDVSGAQLSAAVRCRPFALKAFDGPRCAVSFGIGTGRASAAVKDGLFGILLGSSFQAGSAQAAPGSFHDVALSARIVSQGSTSIFQIALYVDGSLAGQCYAPFDGQSVSRLAIGSDAAGSYPFYGLIGDALVKEGGGSGFDPSSMRSPARSASSLSRLDPLGRLASRSVPGLGQSSFGFAEASGGFATGFPTHEAHGYGAFSYEATHARNPGTGRASSFGGAAVEYDSLGFLSRFGTATYEYDGDGNVLKRKRNGSDEATFSYSYDATSKRKVLTSMVSPSATKAIGYAAANPLYPSTVVTITGTLSTASLHYCMRHLLSASVDGTTYEYGYSADGYLRRKAPSSGEAHAYLFDGARLTLDATATRELWYEYDAEGAPAFLVSKTASAVHRYAFVTDAFGRILALVGVGEAGHASYSYDEWGAPALSSDTTAEGIGSLNRLLYKGYLYLDELGCYALGLRHYDPLLCRFWEPDEPDYIEPFSPAGLNLYAYCGNDPISYADPTGNFGVFTAIMIGLGALAATGLGLMIGGKRSGNEILTNIGDSIISGVEIVAGVLLILTGAGDPVGMGLLGMGAGSILNGLVNWSNGGTYHAGWAGGQLSGALSFIKYAGGGLGAFFGSALTDLIDSQYDFSGIDWGKAACSGAIAFGLSWFGNTITYGGRVLSKTAQIALSYDYALLGLSNSIANVFWRQKKKW